MRPQLQSSELPVDVTEIKSDIRNSEGVLAGAVRMTGRGREDDSFGSMSRGWGAAEA